MLGLFYLQLATSIERFPLDGRSEPMLTLALQFQDGNLSLIHIPINHYSFFLQPILRLLFGEDHDEDAAKIPWTDRHKFLNVSITPVECSVFCSRELADRFFRPLAETFNSVARAKKNGATKTDAVEINPDDFVVVRVDGGGIEAGQRVLELTSPLALAGMYAASARSHLPRQRTDDVSPSVPSSS
jgi:hypothetical protein